MLLVGWKPLDYNFAMPSARIRCLNIIHHFNSHHINLELFDENKQITHYDAVIFSKNYSEESLIQAEQLKQNGKKVILDLFDNRFFEPDDSETSKAATARLHRMLDLADHITTSTTYLKALISSYVPNRDIVNIEDALEEQIADVHESLKKHLRSKLNYIIYRIKLSFYSKGKTHLIWFGTSGDVRLKTGMADLFKLQEMLEQPQFKDRFILTVCSNGRKIFADHIKPWKIPTLFITWNASTFYNVLQSNHIALIPITLNPLTKYKTNNRVITALYNNLAVIADGIPSYKEFADCIVLDDWHKGFEQLSQNNNRNECVAKGKDIIKNKYMPQIIAKRWADFLEDALISKHPEKHKD